MIGLNRKLLNHVCPTNSQRDGQLPQYLQSVCKISLISRLEKSTTHDNPPGNHYPLLGSEKS